MYQTSSRFESTPVLLNDSRGQIQEAKQRKQCYKIFRMFFLTNSLENTSMFSSKPLTKILKCFSHKIITRDTLLQFESSEEPIFFRIIYCDRLINVRVCIFGLLTRSGWATPNKLHPLVNANYSLESHLSDFRIVTPAPDSTVLMSKNRKYYLTDQLKAFTFRMSFSS